MLMDLPKLFEKYDMNIFGVWHIGAHEGQEYDVYKELEIPRVVWVEANHELAQWLVQRFQDDDTQKVMSAAVSDSVKSMTFHLANNNGQSSSLLPLGTHRDHHPDVEYVDRLHVRTTTLDILVRERQIASLNFWNLDIQGSELAALRGGESAINMADYIYAEVNREEVYEGCGLVDEIDEYLGERQFQRVETVWTDFQWGDALYIRENLL